VAGEETRAWIVAPAEDAAAVLPAVGPLAQRAQLQGARHTRGLLPLALVRQTVNATGPHGEPSAIRDRIRPRDAVDRTIRSAPILFPPWGPSPIRGPYPGRRVPRFVDEQR